MSEGETTQAAKKRKLQNFADGMLGDADLRAEAATALALAHLAKSQAFFAELAASIIAPHVHDMYKRNIEELLKRATEKGLYTP